MYDSHIYPRRGAPIVAELSPRPIMGPRAKRWAWRLAFAASDVLILMAAGAAALAALAALLHHLPPIG